MSDVLRHDDTSISNDQEQAEQSEKKTNTSSGSLQEHCYNVDREHRDIRQTIRISETFENFENDVNESHARQHSKFENEDEIDRSSSRVSQVIAVNNADRGSRASIQSQTGRIIPEDKDGTDAESDLETIVNANGVNPKEENEQTRSPFKLKREQSVELESKLSGETEKFFIDCGEPTDDQNEEKAKNMKYTDGKQEGSINVCDMRDNLRPVSHRDYREHVQENDLDKQRNDDSDLSVTNTAEEDGTEGVEGSQGSMSEASTVSQRIKKGCNDSERDIAIDLRKENKVVVKRGRPSTDSNRQKESEIDSGSEKGIIDTLSRDNAIYSSANITYLSTQRRLSDDINEGVNEGKCETTFDIVEEEHKEEGRISGDKDLNTGDDDSRLLENQVMQTPVLNTDENGLNDQEDERLRRTRYDCENNGSNMKASPVDRKLIEGSEITQVVNPIRSENLKENDYLENHESEGSSSNDAPGYSWGKKEYRRDETNHMSDSNDTNIEENFQENAKGVDAGKYGMKNPWSNEATKEKDGEDNAFLPQVASDDSKEHDESKAGYKEEVKERDENANLEGQEKSDGIASDSDEEKLIPERSRPKMIVKKATQTYDLLPKGSLTTILVSREEEERKRQIKGYNREKKYIKRGETQVKYRIGRSEKKRDGSEKESFNHEEGCRIGGVAIAPFTKQYKHKKHIEHVLEEDNYRSDGEAKDKANYINGNCTMRPSTARGLLVDEMMGLWPDSTDKKTGSNTHFRSYIRHSDLIHRQESYDAISAATMRENERQSDYDTDDPLKGKGRHYTSHKKDMLKTKFDKNESGTHANSRKNMVQLYEGLHGTLDDLDVRDSSKNGLPLINIKEIGQKKKMTQKKTRKVEEGSYKSFSTETNRGVEEEEDGTYLDVQLTNGQQNSTSKCLFDELGNLKSEFERNEEGKITRKLEESDVCDPYKGKVRSRRQRGRLFRVPRLKRNKQGRPIGGYYDDPFEPTEQEEVEVELATLDDSIDYNNTGGKRTSSSRQYLRVRTARDLKKEDMTAKTVVFDVPEEGEAMPIDGSELSELRTRGRRYITSAMRRKLRDGLFTRFKERGQAAPNNLPLGCTMKHGWVQTDSNTMESDKRRIIGGGRFLLTPLVRVYGQQSPTWSSGTSFSTPGKHAAGHYRRSIGELSLDLEQHMVFEQWLETDRKVRHVADEQNISTNEYDIKAERHAYYGPHDHPADEMDDFDENCYAQQVPTDTYDRSSTNLSDEGRLIIREKGCPNLKPSTASTWTHQTGGYGASLSHPSSASLRLQNNHRHIMESYNRLLKNRGDTYKQNMTVRNTYLNSTRLSTDYRLRRLLEELFSDKKYLDHLIETTEPQSDTLMITRGIAEHGREFLMERADFWEETGPLTPRPAPSQYGFRKSRAQTSFREDTISLSTFTPDIRPHTMPVTLTGFFPNEK